VQREIYASSSFILAIGNSDPEQRRVREQIAGAANRGIEPSEALVNAAKFVAVRLRNLPAGMELSSRHNHLIFKLYLLAEVFRCELLQETPANSYML
jgi:hypothetical protein